MRFGTWPCPRVEVIARRFRSELGDEIVGGLAKTPICRERDGLEVDVKPFVHDNFVGRAALVVGVDVGGVTTGSLTRRVVDVSVDGGVRDAGVPASKIVLPSWKRPVAVKSPLRMLLSLLSSSRWSSETLDVLT